LGAAADTASDLNAARSLLTQARADLDEANRAWLDAEAQIARSQDAAAEARREIARLEDKLGTITERLNERAVALYMSGGNPAVLAVLGSGSLAEATDRLAFVGAVAGRDVDLANEVEAERQRLQWEQERLEGALEDQRNAAADLKQQEQEIGAALGRYQAQVDELEAKLGRERAAAAAAALREAQREKEAREASPSVGPTPPSSPPGDNGGGSGGGGGGDGGPPPIGTGWLQTCPVRGATSFVDSFGDPRPGGRTHQGTDMLAAYGTPVVAVHPGRVHRTSSSTGGYGTVIFHDGSADWTFYTHFSSYAGPGEGSHVSAGETIGLVGSTGDTTVNHLHFEYHPGGGAAVNPYQSLLGVC
jgi:murein DD-endopeptidase MepM/ murein hydrolase activator NlpD